MIGNGTVSLLSTIPQVVTTKWDKLGFMIVAVVLWIIVYYVIGSPDDADQGE